MSCFEGVVAMHSAMPAIPRTCRVLSGQRRPVVSEDDGGRESFDRSGGSQGARGQYARQRPAFAAGRHARRPASTGYAQFLHHGEIGTGLNDYSTIFRVLRNVGFNGWVSIEDGLNGLDEMRRAAEFLHAALSRTLDLIA